MSTGALHRIAERLNSEKINLYLEIGERATCHLVTESDGPKHKRYRVIVNRAVSPGERWVRRLLDLPSQRTPQEIVWEAEWRQLKSCQSKRAYEKAGHAKGAAIGASVHRGRRLGYYHCSYCGRWHLASIRGQVGRRVKQVATNPVGEAL